MSDATQQPSKERSLTERLRSGFGGLVPPVCDEAANHIDFLEQEIASLRVQIGVMSASFHEPAAAPMKMHVDYEWQKQRLESGGPAEECAAGGPSKPMRKYIWKPEGMFQDEHGSYYEAAYVEQLLATAYQVAAPPEIRILFNGGIGVQKENRFSFSFETAEEAERAFRYIAALGTLETSRSPKEGS